MYSVIVGSERCVQCDGGESERCVECDGGESEVRSVMVESEVCIV